MYKVLLQRMAERIWPHFAWDVVKELPTVLAKPSHAWATLGALTLDPRLAVVLLAGACAVWILSSMRRRPAIDAPIHSFITLGSRLALGAVPAPVTVGSKTVDAISVSNQQDRYENTCVDVRAEVIFKYALTGESVRIHPEQAQFLNLTNTHAEPATNSVDLEDGEVKMLALATYDGHHFSAICHWPLGTTEKRLKFGEWTVQIKLTSDADEDCDERTFRLLLGRNGRAVWTPYLPSVTKQFNKTLLP
jgi:hypothetical protein